MSTAVVQRKKSPPGCIVVPIVASHDSLNLVAASPPRSPPFRSESPTSPTYDDFAVASMSLIKPCVAGLVLSCWALAAQPFNELLCASHEAPWVVSLLLGFLLTAVVLFLDRLVGCSFIVGFSGESSLATAPPTFGAAAGVRREVTRFFQTLLGNITGAVIGATLGALFLQRLEVDGFHQASAVMDAVVDSARVIADELPQVRLASGVFAGFIMAVVTLVVPRVPSATFHRTALRWAVMFAACVVVMHFRFHFGIIDKSLVSATATWNAVQPLTRSLGPNVFNYVYSFTGNILGAVVGRCAVDIVRGLEEGLDGPLGQQQQDFKNASEVVTV